MPESNERVITIAAAPLESPTPKGQGELALPGSGIVSATAHVPPTDPEDANYKRWFDPGLGQISEGNMVDSYVSGADALKSMTDAFLACKDNGDFVLLTAFESSPDTPMRGVPLRLVLQALNERGVAIRALLNGEGYQRTAKRLGSTFVAAVGASPLGRNLLAALGGQPDVGKIPMKDNGPLHALINSLPKARTKRAGIATDEASILDNNYRWLTMAHHQKLALTQSKATGLIAFCGGVDLAVSRASAATWHDVHARLRGPSARALFDMFERRWDAHVPGLFASATLRESIGEPAPSKLVTGPHAVQVAETYPAIEPVKLAQLQALTQLSAPTPHVRPHPTGTSVLPLILRAVGQTREFIYVEDQFMVCDNPLFVSILASKVAEPNFRRLVLFTNRDEVAAEAYSKKTALVRNKRLRLLNDLAPNAALRAKVTVSVRKPGMYVHAKCWMFDDRYAIIGSANMNNRGYSSDSEACVGVADKNEGGNRLFFAHRLRMDLWKKHLGLTEAEAFRWEDHADAWTRESPNTLPYSIVSPSASSAHEDALWNLVYDPR